MYTVDRVLHVTMSVLIFDQLRACVDWEAEIPRPQLTGLQITNCGGLHTAEFSHDGLTN